MLKKIYICGVHSSGKTTLINSLKNKLCRPIENETVLYCPEVARKVVEEHGILSEDLRDVEVFKQLNLTILERQYDEEKRIEKLAEKRNGNTILVFDRGILDPIIYIQMRVGTNYAQSLLQEPHIQELVQGFLNEDECIVFVTKPFLNFFKLDGVRVDTFDFSECMAYDKAMRDLMTSLKIPYIYIQNEDLNERTDFVIHEVTKRWKNVKLVN